MPTRRRDPPNEPPPMAEAELAAAAPTLFGRPGLWAELVLAPDARQRASQQPWQAYWAVRTGSMAAPAADRAVLAQAADAFDANGDRLGAALAVAAVIETYYHDETTLEPLDAWIERLERVLGAEGLPWQHAECAAELAACGSGVLLRQPEHSLAARWALEGPRMLARIGQGPSRLKYAAFVVQYHLWRGEFAACALILDALPGVDLSLLRPPEALLWLQGVAGYARATGDFERGRAAMREALALLDAHALPVQAYSTHGYGAALALAEGDEPAATRHIDAMRSMLAQRSQDDQTHYWHLCAGAALLRGQPQEALQLARHTLAQSHDVGGSYRSTVHRMSLAVCLARAGDFAAARDEALAVMQQARGITAGLTLFTATLLASHAQQRLGETEAADALLAQALALGRANDYATTGSWRQPELVGERFARAIRMGIEPDYARRFAQRARLRCPDPTLEAWPWPMVLRGFGEFELRVNGAPLATAGARVAQRPLDLLRLLLAQSGRSVAVASALEALWPEADFDAQRKAFDAALLRLRRALGDDSLLRLDGGQLLLDRERCWSDVHALSSADWDVAPHRTNPVALNALAERLLHLVRGPLLEGLDAPWAQAAREQARRRFVLTLAPIAQALEPIAPADAVRLYERALQADPLAESLSRRLIALQLARGERTEALRAWHRCKALLALYDAAPSPATLTVVREAAFPV